MCLCHRVAMPKTEKDQRHSRARVYRGLHSSAYTFHTIHRYGGRHPLPPQQQRPTTSFPVPPTNDGGVFLIPPLVMPPPSPRPLTQRCVGHCVLCCAVGMLNWNLVV